MQAFYITQPGKTELGESQQPRPGPGEVLLQTRLIGLCGTDLSTYKGSNPLVNYPRIPGHEIAATIVEIGEGVPTEFTAGTDATVHPTTACGMCASCRRKRFNACKFNETLGVQRDGAMAGYFTAPWQKVFLGKGLSLRELTLVEPLAVGFHAVARGRVQRDDCVAVIGCGTVGLGVVAGAAAAGARVIALDLEDRKLPLAKRAGAQHGVNTRHENVHECLQNLTNGLGPDVIVEAVGNPATYRLAVEEVAHTGRVVFIGWTDQPVTFDVKPFIHKELDILGSRNSLDEFPAVMAMLTRDQFPVDETISTTVPIDLAGDALERWRNEPAAFTKILVEVNA